MSTPHLRFASAALVLFVIADPGCAEQLRSGVARQREISGLASHEYCVALAAGEVVRVSVEQRGADVAVMLRSPGGDPLFEMDGIGGPGVEDLAWQAAEGGTYAIEVRPKRPAPGAYEVRAVIAEADGDAAIDSMAAEMLFMDARAAHRRGSGVDLEEAAEGYRAAADAWQGARDRKWEAVALVNVAMVSTDLNRYDVSREANQRALVLLRELGN